MEKNRTAERNSRAPGVTFLVFWGSPKKDDPREKNKTTPSKRNIWMPIK